MHDSDIVAVHIFLRAVPQHARAIIFQVRRYGINAIDLKTKVVNAAAQIARDKFGDK